MDMLRNPELKRWLALSAGLSLLFTAAGFLLTPAAGLLLAAASVCHILVFLSASGSRYRQIAGLSLEIDRILHGADGLVLTEYREGELAILQNELVKMTKRLREQAEALKKEKTFLADSLADISHQLRTPLTSLNLICSKLKNPALTRENRLEKLCEMDLLLQRIEWLIEALLKISRLDADAVIFRKDTVRIADVASRTAELFAIPLEIRAQTLSIDCGSEVQFTGDMAWTLEAVGNVVKNCMEHNPPGGTITFAAGQNPMYTEIRIADEGPGIAAKDLPHLFERFYKGDNAGKGSVGIGLALAAEIIRRQNGSIQVKNREKGGAEFSIRFYHGAV